MQISKTYFNFAVYKLSGKCGVTKTDDQNRVSKNLHISVHPQNSVAVGGTHSLFSDYTS